ncbi:MAG TPA: fumarylacetoacetate hydrolase family protein [Sphingomonadaceae bacterium]|nr:fumarylacetoacetate hydrolase family protein [Sphingomonadaceae bacterium]
MKLLRSGPAGAEIPAILDPDGVIRDLSQHIGDIGAETVTPAGLERIAALPLDRLPVVDPATRIGACIARPANFVCIGLNYSDHAAEAGLDAPKEPVVFLKSTGSICGAHDAIEIPRGAEKTDWEVELGVVIGTRAKYVTREAALDHVAGYCVVNDISERAFQTERGGTWDKGKGCDTFGPIGPWLVTRDEIPDPQNLRLWCDVDGHRMQDGNTRQMIFDVATIISYVSAFITLHPGDIIATGTPAGVGLGQKPHPMFLKAGQRMRLGIDGLGVQEQALVAA